MVPCDFVIFNFLYSYEATKIYFCYRHTELQCYLKVLFKKDSTVYFRKSKGKCKKIIDWFHIGTRLMQEKNQSPLPLIPQIVSLFLFS